MVKSALSLAKNLIISRIQQKDLAQIKPHQRGIHSSRNLTTLTLNPLFDPLPIQAGLMLHLVGEKIFDAKIQRDFFKQGLEENLSVSNFGQGMKALERLHKTTPIFYQMAYQIACEELFDLDTDQQVARMRSLALEFSRFHHHLTTLENLFFCLNLDDMAKLTSYINRQLAHLSHSWFRVFLKNQTPQHIPSYEQLDELLDELVLDFRDLEIQASESKELKSALLNKGFINLSTAGSFGLTGAFLHANGHAYDPHRGSSARIDYPVKPAIWIQEGGDIFARFLVRLMESKFCLNWLKERLQHNQRNGITLMPLTYEPHLSAPTTQKTQAAANIAGPEGDIKVSVFFSHETNSATFSLLTSAFMIAQAIPYLLYNASLADLPMVLYSLGITDSVFDK